MKNGFYRPDIDGLRGIAITLVISFHLFPDWSPAGYLGVDIFFVISGYLITRILLQKNLPQNTLSEFYKRRLLRLAPALVAILIFTFTFGWLQLFPNEFLELCQQIAAGSVFLMNLLLFTQANYFDSAAQTKPLMHLWSLGIEEQFYLIWPIALLLTNRLINNNHRHISVLALLIFSLTCHYSTNQLNAKIAFYLPFCRFWELLIGCTIASNQRYFSLRHSHIANVFAVIFLAAACLLFPATAGDTTQLLLACLGAALLIGSNSNAPINKIILSNRLLVGLGLLSYSLYLWHWPLISFFYILSGHQQLDLLNSLILLVQIFIGASLTYYLIERPLRYSRAKYTAAILCVTLLTIGILSWSHTHWHWIKPYNNEFIQTGDGYSKYFVAVRRDINFIPNLLNQRNDLIRAGKCKYRILSLEEELNYNHADDACLQIATDKRNVIVFGDSYADDLYASLTIAYPDINFIQLTGCSFHIDSEEGCRPRVNYLLKLLADDNVESVVIANYWRESFIKAAPLLNTLQLQPKRVIVFGSAPEFIQPAYLVAGNRDKTLSPAESITAHLDHASIANAIKARQYFIQRPLQYVDRMEIFCKTEPTSITTSHCELVNDQGEPYLWDFGHLFPAGMNRIAQHLQSINLF